ncbi:MAG TPA: type I DNA topoisomerase [Alphaproteobacteria bacterium]|jgi:DNA topoisomerase-1|nr:type I DNA topoisomerase [Alphaproteobacteria bacterium]
MNLIIVESPTKAKTLGKFLGKDYVVEATMGHIKDLPKSKLGVDIEHDFKPDFIEVEKRAATIKLLKSSAKKAKIIFIASDPDREGEAIAQHVNDIISVHGSPLTIHRITFHEITKEAVEEALNHPGKINQDLVDAQTARRVLDRLVGYKLSPLLWKKVRVGLSAGRVQSVAVRLIVEKEREIEKFKSDEYWEIYVTVHRSPLTVDKFTVQLIKQEIKNKTQADKILADLEKANYKVLDVKKRQVVKNPYPPFTTSTMTQTAARLFGWSSKKTMSIAQGLYEEGLITYHRTDSLNLNFAAVEKARQHISKEYGQNYLPEKPRLYKTTSKSAQEAHEAIRVTDVGREPSTVNGEHGEQKLYDLIWKRFLACQMASAIYDETTIDVSAAVHSSPFTVHYLRASGQIMIFDGWRKLFPLDSQVVILPDVKKDEELKKIKVWGEQKFTQPPARFNEASLIKTLEKLGIGRPSTYAPTISTIQVRNYVEKKEGKFFPTTIGIAVNDFLIGNFPDTFDYGFTAGMEGKLDEVANGKLKWQKEIGSFWKPLSKKIVNVEKNSTRVKIEVEKLGKKCPDCKDGELVIRTGRFGKFISCSLFPECKHTEKYLEKTGMQCPECGSGDVIVKKSGKGRKFFGCSRYPECKFASWQIPKKEENTTNGKST